MSIRQSYKLLVASALSTIPYFINENVITKTLPILLLTIMCANVTQERARWSTPYASLMAAGLFLSAFGDAALVYAKMGSEEMFLLGLAFFLFAHVLYIRAFITQVRLKFPLKPVSLVVAAYAAVMRVLLADMKHELIAPVMVYGAVLVTMSLCSYNLVMSLPKRTWRDLAPLLGSIIFIVSDMSLAFNKFVVPINYSKELIMITYYAGQHLLALSVLA
jgi:uncharacterized membrane protein YhhN